MIRSTALAGLACGCLALAARAEETPIQEALASAAKRVVKLYGAGGLGRAQGYGTGILVTSEGHVLTVLGPLLEADAPRAVLADGRRLEGRLVAVDPARQWAVLKFPVQTSNVFSLEEDSSAPVEPGTVVFALSNLFNIAAGNEPVSVQRGVVAGFLAAAPRGDGASPTVLVDAVTSNPGAAGGALVDSAGRLVGMLAKERRDEASGAWINVAYSVAQFRGFVRSAIAGEALPDPRESAATSRSRSARARSPIDFRGLRMLPDVLDRTPAYVDGVESGSPAEAAGLSADDLILYVGEEMVHDLAEFEAAVASLPADKPWSIVVLRDGRLETVSVPARSGAKP